MSSCNFKMKKLKTKGLINPVHSHVHTLAEPFQSGNLLPAFLFLPNGLGIYCPHRALSLANGAMGATLRRRHTKYITKVGGKDLEQHQPREDRVWWWSPFFSVKCDLAHLNIIDKESVTLCFASLRPCDALLSVTTPRLLPQENILGKSKKEFCSSCFLLA